MTTNQDRAAFEAWWEKFQAEHEDWKYADSDALRWATWQASTEALRAAIIKLHAAKGRYPTQLAACDLFDAVGLKNERPMK